MGLHSHFNAMGYSVLCLLLFKNIYIGNMFVSDGITNYVLKHVKTFKCGNAIPGDMSILNAMHSY